MGGVRRDGWRGVRVDRAPRPDLPMRYLLAGVTGFLVFAGAVPWLAPDLLRGNDDPHVFALTHLAVLGWITMVMMGALYQLFPVALSGEIRDPALGRWNFWVYGIGVAGFVPSFFLNWTLGVAIFGALTVAGIVHFVANLLRSYPSIRIWHPMASYLLAALGWLVLTIVFGFAYALNWQFRWFAVSDAMLAAHVHLGLAGWLSLTLMGVSYKLVAMFALAYGHSERVARWNLGAWNLGLAGLTLSLLFQPHTMLVLLFAIWLAASAVVFVADMVLLLRKRRRRRLSLEQWHSFVAFGSLLVAAGMGVLLASGHPLTRTWVVAYGYVAIVGWFGFSIIGKLYKIIPFLAWLHRFAPAAGARPVALIQDLVDARLGWLSFILLLTGYVGVVGGLLVSALPLLRWSAVAFAAGAVVFSWNLASIDGLWRALRAQVRPSRQGGGA